MRTEFTAPFRYHDGVTYFCRTKMRPRKLFQLFEAYCGYRNYLRHLYYKAGELTGSDIGIVTPYTAQESLIKETIGMKGGMKEGDLFYGIEVDRSTLK